MVQSGAGHQRHDADSLRLMALALDGVWEQLPENSRSDATRQKLALLIVELFEGGEHDPARLSLLAVSEILPGREDSGAA
jgi:hypothetical protein